MCGIVGARHDWLVQQGLEPERAMRAAVDALRWRGPDGADVVRAGAWWLGCARLAIGPARARQPVVRRGGRFAGVMNGAITNARAMWPRFLPGVEHRAMLPNDAWLPLLAVERGDVRALHSLRGHHAYAVADTETGELVVGRDVYGEKPLVALFERLRGASTLVAFASTRAALATLGVPVDVPARRLAEWFRFGWSWPRDERRTTRRVVSSLPVRSVQTVRSAPLVAAPNGGRARWRTWGETPYPPRHLKADRAWIRVALIASVTRCTDTVVPA